MTLSSVSGSPVETAATVRNSDGTCPVCGWFNCRHIPAELLIDPADECGAHSLTWCHQCNDALAHVLTRIKPLTVDCDAHGLTSCLDCGLNVRPEIAAVWRDAPDCYGCDGRGWIWTAIAGDAGQWDPCPQCDCSGRWISDATIEHLQRVEDMYATGVTHPEQPPKHIDVCSVKTGAHNRRNAPIEGFRNNAANILTPPKTAHPNLRCQGGPWSAYAHSHPGRLPKDVCPLDCGQCDPVSGMAQAGDLNTVRAGQGL